MSEQSRCFGLNFLVTAQNLGYEDHDVRRVWRRVVSRAMGAEYTVEHAFNEHITYQQLWIIVQDESGSAQFRRMPETDWQMIISVAGVLFSGLSE
jgi:hypothetical protein